MYNPVAVEKLCYAEACSGVVYAGTAAVVAGLIRAPECLLSKRSPRRGFSDAMRFAEDEARFDIS